MGKECVYQTDDFVANKPVLDRKPVLRNPKTHSVLHQCTACGDFTSDPQRDNGRCSACADPRYMVCRCKETTPVGNGVCDSCALPIVHCMSDVNRDKAIALLPELADQVVHSVRSPD